MTDAVFFLDGFVGNAQGGWFFRAFDLVEFMKKIEKDPRGGKVVGFKFDDNNVELITEKTGHE